MAREKYDIGMYFIDNDYKILYLNSATMEMYPNVKIGDLCYQTLAHGEEACPHCPIKKKSSTFYNPRTREWIAAQAAQMNLPEYGECYCIQYQLKQRIGHSVQGLRPYEDVAEHIEEISTMAGSECAIGGYCEDGFPLFYANEKMVELLGYDNMEEFIQGIDGKVINTIHPEDRAQVQRDLGDSYHPGMTYETVYRMPRKDGTWFWTVDKGKVIKTEDGRLAIISVCVDMTGFVKRQSDLKAQNEMLRQKDVLMTAMMNNMPGGYHRCAPQEGCPILHVGTHFEEIVGWTKDEIKIKFDNLYSNLIWPEDIGVMKTYSDMSAMKGKGNTYDSSIYRIKHRDGGYRWVADSTMFVDLGEDSFLQATITDITEYIDGMKNQQKNLESALERIETVSKAKSAFLFNVSHDIRTPMNAIQGFNDIIRQHPQDEELVKNMTGKIKKSSDTLMQLLNDVLELSRIESGKVELDFMPVNLKCFMDKLYYMFLQEMEQAGIVFELQDNLEALTVLCDDLKCTRIVMNMLSNARKFTPSGGKVVLGAEQLPSEKEGHGTYHFYVKDTGIGMSETFLQRAFEEFERERTSTDSGLSGSGLGLAIIKNLVELMDGSCTLESKLGQGTEIGAILTLPLAPQIVIESEKTQNPPIKFEGKRVLLVEDNDFNREIACYILENLGVVVEQANNGSEAVSMLLRGDTPGYDLVLMDIQMPIMDGYKATREIRNFDKKEIANIPILAMTANAFKEDKEKCLEVGMNGHISKPIDAQMLMKELRKVL